jgi:hypothetical protein
MIRIPRTPGSERERLLHRIRALEAMLQALEEVIAATEALRPGHRSTTPERSH